MKKEEVISEIGQMIREIENSSGHILQDCACSECWVNQHKIDVLAELKKRLELLR